VLLTHRFYDPENGQFLTKDPIGYEGGINLYGYVGDNPANWADPEGYAKTYGSGTPGFGKSTYEYNWREQPGPDLHIWHQNGETIVSFRGGFEEGMHKGKPLQPLPKKLHDNYKDMIDKFHNDPRCDNAREDERQRKEKQKNGKPKQTPILLDPPMSPVKMPSVRMPELPFPLELEPVFPF
jgi:hypothetical protein